MEKKKKGLFGRLLDFWREKIDMDERNSIGFWNETVDSGERRAAGFWNGGAEPDKSTVVGFGDEGVERNKNAGVGFWDDGNEPYDRNNIGVWNEMIDSRGKDSIGFWNDGGNVEQFAEIGTVGTLIQEEMKKAFWEETAGVVLEETAEENVLNKEKQIFLAEDTEEWKEEKFDFSEEAEKVVEKQKKRIFAAEIFSEEKQAETEGESFRRTFLWEMPVEEREKRSIIPVTEGTGHKEDAVSEKQQEVPKMKVVRKEEPQKTQEIDIEKLMREMTKKLWEERESCGRRLR